MRELSVELNVSGYVSAEDNLSKRVGGEKDEDEDENEDWKERFSVLVHNVDVYRRPSIIILNGELLELSELILRNLFYKQNAN